MFTRVSILYLDGYVSMCANHSSFLEAGKTKVCCGFVMISYDIRDPSEGLNCSRGHQNGGNCREPRKKMFGLKRALQYVAICCNVDVS